MPSSQKRGFSLSLSWRLYNCKKEIFRKGGKDKKWNGGNE